MAIMYIKGLVDSLSNHFKVDFDLFEVAKYFSPKNYDQDLQKLDFFTIRWLGVLCKHFGKGANSFINEEECKGERGSFITRTRNCFKGKSMHSAWQYCCNHEEWEVSFPWTMKLWRALLLLPLSSVACERGFSKMNKIKNKSRNRLSLASLGLAMFVGLNTPKASCPQDVLWEECFDMWKSMRK
ncbi:hypothetical protein GOP47_0027876 [Adiantum capillus-veneris]|nr:hypothetical protein GOP47_0027876 [Adiantum capillus-veneris]